MELPLIRFLKSLPQKQRNFYLLMNAYNLTLNELGDRYPDNDNDSKQEGVKLISEFFETEISRLLETSSSPFYESQTTRNEKAEKSIPDKLNIIDQMNAVNLADDEFDEKLGKWASSFSDSDDETNKKDRRLANESDLSSDDEDQEKHKSSKLFQLIPENAISTNRV
jgi:hypothetical protein